MQIKKVIILILTIAVVTVFSGCIKKTEKPVVKNNNEQKVEKQKIKEIATSTEDNNKIENQKIEKIATSTDEINISDWQIYKNEEFGFEVKYHPYWEIATFGVTNDLSKNHIVETNLFNNYVSKQKEALPILSFTIFDENKKFNESDKYIIGEIINDRFINDLYIKIYKKENYFGVCYSAIIELKNDYIFLIKVDQVKDKNESLKIFNQIISTFKFIK